MPPEPSPWDRKDFLRERKYEGAVATATGKWKGSYSKSGDVASLRPSRSDDAPRVSGFGKQGSYRLFPEESSYGTTPRPATDPRSHDRMIDDDNCRPSSSHRLDSKISRNIRDLKGVDTASSKSSQREFKGYQSDNADGYFPSSVNRHEEPVRYICYHYHSHSGPENSLDRNHFEKQNDKMGIDELHGRYSERSMDIRIDRLTGSQGSYSNETSLASIRWKPLQWARPTSAGSKSCRSEDKNVSELARKITPSPSSSGDASAGVTISISVDSSHAMKKQRLGWGQGLAKYEKEKVEGHEDPCSKSDPGLQSTPLRVLQDEISTVTAKQECASPTAMPSAACSLPSGEKDKDSIKDSCNIGDVPSRGFFGEGVCGVAEEFTGNLDNLDINTIYTLISDVMHSEDSFSDHPTSKGSASLDKLASLKKGLMKLLEKKEYEIDLSENELRSLGTGTVGMNVCNSAANSCHDVTDALSNESEKPQEASPRFNLLDDPTQSQPSALVPTSLESIECVPCDVQCEKTGELVDACQTCEPNFIGLTSGTDVDMMNFTFDKKASVKPSINVEVLGCDAARNCATQDVIGHGTYASADLTKPGAIQTTLTTSILAVNKELAREASEELLRFLPVRIHRINSVLREISCRASDTEMHESISASMRRNFAKRKCYIRFKERALTLKYRAFYHLWREDLRLLSIRKYRSKQQKRLEPSSRSFQIGFQKHRSSIRSRFTSPGGNLTLVPTAEVVAFTGKLLSDSLMKVCRNNLKMPAMILDEERHSSKFVSWNGLVEDPCSVEKERSMINPWTTEETEVFIEALIAFGKNFSKIASFLKHKTTADCVEFYYKNHKSEKFQRVKKSMGKTKEAKGAAASTYLSTTGKKWNHEKSTAYLDVLGAASVAAAHCFENQRPGHKCVDGLPDDGYYGCKMSEMDDGVLERTGNLDVLGNERDARAGAGDLMFGICGALSSEAVSSCVTSSVGPGDGSNDWKYQKMESGFDTPLTPEVMQSAEEDTCSEESCGLVAFSDWTDAEKAIFITALRSYGKDFATISRCVGSRSKDQCKIFFSKARKCLGLDVIHVGLGNEGTPLSDARGGRSDTEDACAGEMDSAFCSIRSCSKLETDGSSVGFGDSMVSSSNEGYGYSASNSVQVKETVTADTEERTRLSRELQIKNETDYPAVSLIQESAVLQCDVGTEKMEVMDPLVEEEQDLGGSTIDVVGQGNDGTALGVKVEVGPDTLMHDSQLTESCGNCEAVNHQTDVAAMPKQNEGIDSDAHVNGPSNVLNEQSVSEPVVRPCSSKQLILDPTSEEQNSTALVIPSAKDSNHGVTLFPKTEISNDNNGLFNCCLDVNDSLHSHGRKNSPPGTSSASSYDPRVTDGPLLPTSEVLGCGKKSQSISWQQDGCPAALSNIDQPAGRENSKVASSASHYEGSILQVVQPSQIQESGNRMPVQEPLKAMCSFTMSDFYRPHNAGSPSFNKTDQPLQNNCTSYSLQSINKEDGGSASSVSEKQASLPGLGNMKKLHDLLKSNLTLQNRFFIQENGIGHRNYNNHTKYSLFLPKNMDSLDGVTETVSSEEASLFDASYGLKHHISKKCGTFPGSEGESSTPGEVKLFGQNLVVHQPANKQVSSQTESRMPQKVYPLQERNGNAVGTNLSENKGADDIPRCTYGFWDGTRTGSGLSTLTDSGLLVSGGCRVTDSRGASCHGMEQCTLSSAKVDDRMFYASREAIGTSGLTNYHIYSNEVVQPFTVEVTRPLSVVPDIQKRSIMLEKMQQPLLGMQHQACGVGGVNVVNCLTDPVAALKMQYAENFCMQNGVREDDKWRGDINRYRSRET